MKLLLVLLLTSSYIFASEAFISASDLKGLLSKPNLVLIDTTNNQNFKKGHIPNAVNAQMSGFRHQVGTYQLINTPKEIEEAARSLGINKDSYVVIYGHNGTKELLKSSYVALALIANGFHNISILNGTYAEWMYEYDKLVSKDTTKVKEGNFTSHFNPKFIVDLEYVKSHIGKVAMLESRPKKYYDSEAHSSGVRRLGHIPTAVTSFWGDKFDTDDTVKSTNELNKIFLNKNKLNPNKEVIVYCTGGLEASMNWYILHKKLHFKNVKIYDASMREWGNRDDTPLEK